MIDDEDDDPRPDLADVLQIVEILGSIPMRHRNWRRAALSLADADLGALSGLVVKGEAHAARIFEEFAVCYCGDELHEYRRDAPIGRAHWHSTREAAEEELEHGRLFRAKWEPKRPAPHLVSHFVASTATRVIIP